MYSTAVLADLIWWLFDYKKLITGFSSDSLSDYYLLSSWDFRDLSSNYENVFTVNYWVLNYFKRLAWKASLVALACPSGIKRDKQRCLQQQSSSYKQSGFDKLSCSNKQKIFDKQRCSDKHMLKTCIQFAVLEGEKKCTPLIRLTLPSDHRSYVFLLKCLIYNKKYFLDTFWVM